MERQKPGCVMSIKDCDRDRQVTKGSDIILDYTNNTNSYNI